MQADSFQDKPKRLGRPPKKKIQPMPQSSTVAPETNLPTKLPSNLTDKSEEVDAVLKQVLDNIIQNGANRYADTANRQIRETRKDIETLQPIVSEFLENFIIIGHTLDGERVVARYTRNPAGQDALTELCKKVLVNMMIQESHGE